MLTSENIYTENNPYGYKLNINYPLIRALYVRYKRWKNIPYNVPLSDNERFEFEDYVEDYLSKSKGCETNAETKTDRVCTSHTLPD